MTIFDNNLKFLKKNNEHVYKLVLDVKQDSHIESTQSKMGDMIPVIHKDGKKIFVHSKFNPQKEAKRFCDDIDPINHDLVIIFGFGFAYHIEALFHNLNKDIVILAIEKDLSIVLNAFKNRDLTTILQDERFKLLINPNEDDISEILRGHSSSRVCFAIHRGSFQVDPSYYNNIQQIARSYISNKEVNIATLAKFEKIWSSNLARNIKKFILNPGINIFYDQFKEFPAIIVAAGPSLNESIEFIQNNKENAIIIAVDTALKVLQQNNIEPHFCVAVDPQVINARYFEGVKHGSTVLISDPTVHPSVIRMFNGRVVTSSVAFDMLRWIEEKVGVKGEMAHGGSVSTNAYDFAQRIGASPLIMIGQDLGFTNGYAHARGSYLDEQIHYRTNRLITPEMFNRKQLYALPVIKMKGIKNKCINTNQKMMIFLNWFRKMNNSNLINATVDGVYIPGIKHEEINNITLEETNSEISLVIDSMFRKYSESSDNVNKIEIITSELQKMIIEIDTLIPVLYKAVKFSEELASNIKKKDRGRLDYILKNLSKTDRIIEKKKNIKDIISITVQRTIHTITEGYDIDLNDSSLSDDDRIAKRSLYLYNGLLEGAYFNKKIVNKMLKILK